MPDFNKVFENYTGSGNINGKYWIFGLEDGGKLDWNENEYIKKINLEDELAIAKYLSDFNGYDIENKGFLGLLNKTLISIKEYDKCIQDNKYNFSKTGNVFRTNLYPLKHENIEVPLSNIYKDIFNLDDKMTKHDLYNEEVIKKRAILLKSKMDIENKEKIILLILPVSTNEKHLTDSFILINSIFDSDFNTENYSFDKFPNKINYYTEYLSSNKDIRVIHYPQAKQPQLCQSDVDFVIQRLDLV